MKIKSFTDLLVWQEAHQLSLVIYKVTKEFPKSELYGLVNQMRRCAVSITSNIAEGFSRKNKKEKIQFYYISLGSISELLSQLFLARDLGFVGSDAFSDLSKKLETVGKMLQGLIKSSRSRS